MLKHTSLALLLCCSAAMAEDIRIELKALPELQRYVQLLDRPGYIAIALENSGFAATRSSKMKVDQQGRSAETGKAKVTFTGRTGDVFSYEAAYLLGLGDSKLSFPVLVDTSALRLGTVTVTLSVPLAQLMTKDLVDRVQLKAELISNASVQRKVLDYLDAMSRHDDLVKAILVDAYNRGGGAATAASDVGDALPLSDQWMLLLTLVIWLILLPIALLVYRLRRRRAKPAVQ